MFIQQHHKMFELILIEGSKKQYFFKKMSKFPEKSQTYLSMISLKKIGESPDLEGYNGYGLLSP